MAFELDLSFEVITDDISNAGKTCSTGCTSGGSSVCCTAICSGGCKSKINEQASQEAWDQYLNLNTGVLQY